ncbi:PPC domain-containing protein [Nostoc sp. FACHB-280]|uniref:PPC domain-containing protein n=1 Tax=Nostoc sp. FACHB-280 TaxID=2692839 RepID=UPI00168B0EF0|nr:PPC domain-containing protein [Nostoc sp. FACHB-280]MBD2496231.1 peptidase [Nostoc sp. FACHB-280]
MAEKSNQKLRKRINVTLFISVSSVAIASHILPISALEIPTFSQQFQLAKTPDERQPEAVQQGIEQIPAAEPPVTPQRTQSIDSPLPVSVPPPESNPTPQPSPTNSTPEASPPESNPTPQPAPVRSNPGETNSSPQPAPINSPPRNSNPTPQPAPVRSNPRGTNSPPQPSQNRSVSPTPGRRQTPNTNSGRSRNSRGVAAANSRTPNYRNINFVDIAFGILDKRDFQSQGRPYHFYQFEGRENQLIQIRLLGSADQRRSNNLSLRPYMFLLDPNNNVILKRGGGETERDAFIFARLPVAGIYTIAVTSQNPGDTGRYSLAIRDDRASYILDETGELSQQNLVLKQNGTPYNVTQFQGTKNQLVSIRVDSVNEEFSPYIVLLNSQGQRIAANSDRDGKYSTLIDRARLPEDGTYYIVVTSSRPNQRGNYRLTLF